MNEKELTKIPIKDLSDDEFIKAFSIKTIKARKNNKFYFNTFGQCLDILFKSSIINQERYLKLNQKENVI